MGAIDIKETMWKQRCIFLSKNGHTDFEWLLSYNDFKDLVKEFRTFNSFAINMDNENRDIFYFCGVKGSWSPLIKYGDVKLVVSNY